MGGKKEEKQQGSGCRRMPHIYRHNGYRVQGGGGWTGGCEGSACFKRGGGWTGGCEGSACLKQRGGANGPAPAGMGTGGVWPAPPKKRKRKKRKRSEGDEFARKGEHYTTRFNPDN